ncbi:MAG: sugar-transfer associated ATP-grasp domain-containing protein [Acutalibacteraceae bacterium]
MINELHAKTKKSRFFLLKDIANCAKNYCAGYMDYRMFNMYDLTDEERSIILTSGKNNELVAKLNPKEYAKLFHEKILFNQRFHAFLGRSWINLSESSVDDFKEFLADKDRIIVKPVDSCCGQGIEVIEPSKYETAQKLYDYLIETKRPLVEEVIEQADEMKAIYPYAVNTFRIVTVISDSGKVSIVGSYLRVGNNGNVVDNFNHGGIAAPINTKTGKLEHLFRDKRSNYYEKHPETQFPLYGYTFKRWNEIIETAKKLALVVPQMRYVGWDLCLTKKGVAVIEANEYPGNDLYQLPKEHIGTFDIIEAAISCNDI